MRTLNLGILAHVDAGKTSLTERLLYEAGVIGRIGSVDRGDTRTDTLALERERGITIQSAVVSFRIDDVVVNLIDTPGHPDFIAEVERVLDVLDGVVLVVSAVEGVQAQTRVLYRALQRLRLPTVLFVNKIDRPGAREGALIEELRTRLTPAIVPLMRAGAIGGRDATVEWLHFESEAEQLGALDVLGASHPALLDTLLARPGPAHADAVQAAIHAASRSALLHPLLFGSAITGAGVRALLQALPGLLPAAPPDAGDGQAGTVFRIERDRGGARVACVALRTGTVAVRSSIRVAGELRRVTAIELFEQAECVSQDRLCAGRIGKLHGLGNVRIGDVIGSGHERGPQSHFAPPSLQTVVTAANAAHERRLHAALVRLAEQDPLIALRRDDARNETTLSLYGEVQKEVIAETIRRELDIALSFSPSTMLYVERPIATGAARRGPPHPFIALVALRIAPAAPGSGVTLVPEIDYGVLPMAFHLAVEAAIHDTLQQGLDGWPVIDCVVYITEAIRFRDWAASTPADHRALTPLVVMSALLAAGTQVCEPVHRFVVHAPVDAMTALLALLARLGAALEPPGLHAREIELCGELVADRITLLQRELPALTHGEGTLESTFAHYRPVRGARPQRSRIGPDPRDRKTYLMQLGRR